MRILGILCLLFTLVLFLMSCPVANKPGNAANTAEAGMIILFYWLIGTVFGVIGLFLMRSASRKKQSQTTQDKVAELQKKIEELEKSKS